MCLQQCVLRWMGKQIWPKRSPLNMARKFRKGFFCQDEVSPSITYPRHWVWVLGGAHKPTNQHCKKELFVWHSTTKHFWQSLCHCNSFLSRSHTAPPSPPHSAMKLNPSLRFCILHASCYVVWGGKRDSDRNTHTLLSLSISLCSGGNTRKRHQCRSVTKSPNQ